ncbi:MAG: magnesium/cobalt transporter CorA [Candidatus Cyclobacteriaceae bacterium M3_2C_046]
MVNIFYRSENKIIRGYDLDIVRTIPDKDIIWIDLLQPDEPERLQVEEIYDIKLQSRQEVEEIESSSRYYETEERILANSNFLIRKQDNYQNEPVSFIVRNHILISYRHYQLKSFNDIIRKLELYNKTIFDSYDILVSIFEIRIDEDADQLENIAKEISLLGKKITIEKNLNEEVIINITRYQEITMMLRENIIDKQRVISGILKSQYFPQASYPKLRVMIKDTGSLLEHTTFSFERLEYLQNTFLGLIDLEQSKIIKIFTVVTVIFMPPTLIASLYGMNFKFMPELEWYFGYPFALGVMVISSLITLLFFKRKKWL